MMRRPPGRWRARVGRAVLAGGLLAGGAARGHGTPVPIEARAVASSKPTMEYDQEAPAPPGTPAPRPNWTADAAVAWAGRSLLGEAFELRPALAERGLSLHAAFTQFGQGVAHGGARTGAAWGGKFDLLGHLDSSGLGLRPGTTLDVFAEARLG